MDVSIIIVTYNTLQMTHECIESIFEKTEGVEYEIILIDNASTDGSKEFFEGESRIKYIYNKENLGFGKANNIGYGYAQGDYILLLNSDTLLVNNAVYYFWKEATHSNKSIGFWGSYLYNKEGKVIHSYGKFPSLLDFLFKRRVENLSEIEYKIVDYITGADLFIRKDILKEIGFFDEDFFMYYEETELQRRYNTQGILSAIIPQPKIIHLAPELSNRRLSKLILNYGGKKLYAKKCFNVLQYAIFRILSICYYPLIVWRYSGTPRQKIKFITSLVK